MGMEHAADWHLFSRKIALISTAVSSMISRWPMTAAEAAPAKRARAENFIVLKDQRVTRVKNECGKPSINERLSDEGKTVTCPTKARPNKIQRRDAINIGSNGPRPKDRGYPYQTRSARESQAIFQR